MSDDAQAVVVEVPKALGAALDEFHFPTLQAAGSEDEGYPSNILDGTLLADPKGLPLPKYRQFELWAFGCR